MPRGTQISCTTPRSNARESLGVRYGSWLRQRLPTAYDDAGYIGPKKFRCISTQIRVCLFDGLTTLNTTTEKRLLIDLNMLSQCYERRKIVEILWIPGDQNPADGLTKHNACNALKKLMQTNQIKVTPNAWIERDPPRWASDPKKRK